MSFPHEDKLIKSQHLYEQRKLIQKTSSCRPLRTPCDVLVDMYPSLTPIWDHILCEYIRPSYEQKKLPWVSKSKYHHPDRFIIQVTDSSRISNRLLEHMLFSLFSLCN
jgi:hypothetical protein